MSYHTEEEKKKKITKKRRGKHLSMHQLHTDVQKIRLMPLSPTTSPWEGGATQPWSPKRGKRKTAQGQVYHLLLVKAMKGNK